LLRRFGVLIPFTALVRFMNVTDGRTDRSRYGEICRKNRCLYLTFCNAA